MEFKKINLKHEIRTRDGEPLESLYRALVMDQDVYYECMKQGGKWFCAITEFDFENGSWAIRPEGDPAYPYTFDTLRDCKEWAEKQHKARMEFGSIGDSISETPEKPDPVLSARYSIQYRFREDRTDCDSPWEKDWHNELCGSDFECPAEAVDFCNNSGLVISDEGVRMKTDVQYRVVKRTEEVFFDPTSTEHKQ